MALLIGDVSVDDDELVTGTGLARALYDAIESEEEPGLLTSASATLPPPAAWQGNEAGWRLKMKEVRLSARRRWARTARAMANGLLSYLVEHAEVEVTIPTSSAGAGLQRDPTTTNPTLAPATPRTLSGTLT